MNTDKHRTRIASFLLSLYLMILAVGVLHVHEHVDEEFFCQDCASHVCHAGHITMGDTAHDDCLVCSFFSITYLAAQAVTMVFVATVLKSIFVERTQQVVCHERCVISLRAPPCL